MEAEAKIQELWKRETEIQNAIENLDTIIKRKTANGEDVDALRSIVNELDESGGKLLKEIDDLQQAGFCKDADGITEQLISGERNAVEAVAGILTIYNRWHECAAETQAQEV